MLQTRVWGRHRRDFMESLTVVDLINIKPNTGALTVFTNPEGGIIDDLIVTDAVDHLYVVSNAGCRAGDVALMKDRQAEMEAAGQEVVLEFLTDRGLVAVQGPGTVSCLQPLTSLDLSQLGFMQSSLCRVAGLECRVTRCGYTGEDGVEISLAGGDAPSLVDALLQAPAGQPALAGLGARDSLRLEAGLCLYGSDIDCTTTPVEAGLAWLISKPRRARGGFPGEEKILEQLRGGVRRKRVGLLSRGAPARANTEILDLAGHTVGRITSGGNNHHSCTQQCTQHYTGCPSPSLGGGTNVAMGYLEDTKLCKIGTELLLNVRNKHIQTKVTKMPFVPSNYFHIK